MIYRASTCEIKIIIIDDVSDPFEIDLNFFLLSVASIERDMRKCSNKCWRNCCLPITIEPFAREKNGFRCEYTILNKLVLNLTD